MTTNKTFTLILFMGCLFCSLWFILILTFTLSHSYQFKTLYQWSQIEYEFESEDQRSAAIANGTFGIGRVQPIDVQTTNDSPNHSNTSRIRFFVTTPRLTSKGVPATLSVITSNTIDGNPVIRPYPHWSWHLNPESCNAERIVSAFRVWADECGRLWVIDSGFVGGSFVCNPQILAFDIATDQLIYKHEVPQSIHKNTATYVTPIAEVLDSCLDTWLYVADPATPSLLVHSLKLSQSWAVQDASFEAKESWVNFTVAGDTFNAAAGIDSVALSAASDGDQRKLAYHAMSNVNEGYVYTKELRNVQVLENGGGDIFHTYANSRDQQSSVEAYDAKGRLHFSLLRDVQIARWNGIREYGPQNFIIVGDDQTTLQFPTGMKIGKYLQNIEGMWVFATRYQKWASGSLSTNEINFRILFNYFLT